jgi:hypothetical protein
VGTAYYVRARGRISGPFDPVALQRMVRRGVLSRVHEVSTDKLKWVAAAELAEVFEAAHPSRDAAQHEADGPSTATTVVPAAPAVSRTDQNLASYYYSQGGTAIGPMSLPVLKALAQNGTLRANDMVWKEDAEIATPAYQLTQLAGIFSPASSSARARPIAGGSNVPAFVKLREQVRDWATIAGFVIGGAVLLLVNLPLLQVGNRSIFWWHVAGGDAAAFTLNCFYVLLVAITLCILAGLLQGRARSLVYICLAAFGLVMWGLSPLFTTGPASGQTAASCLLLIPPLAAGVFVIARLRGVLPEYAPGRVLVTVFGGVLALAGLVSSMILLVEMNGAAGDWDVVPGWATAVLVLVVLSCVTALATGILGIINIKPSFSTGLNITVIVMSLVTIFLSLLYAIILMIGVSDLAGVASELARDLGGSTSGAPTAAAIGFLLFRLGFVFYAFVALLAIGLLELLISLADRQAHPTRGFSL